ncbi:metal ABC transporter substrate-binding protein [Bifidobacterium mongoliense]|jgi:manganese/iron transport system substrate-binding protein/manganese transport system substrate-binding protein|uniref:Metal ABC transporter substrate-binding protein n=1 Tax=Bifidobacterium mongoliense TaxID=518643 RepID=A0A423UBS3_9BIFI|nr:metal ABC transporter substrate-binding protein [Bifidobacterium mongoliense]MDN5979320.1 metal ABC transporter substrate-binding protein [Bifidobacterium mongoliense]MDN6025719.1 metal ABC transporter substrate-binding protein [Bifidobacterium mongoliense]MDN6051744.1 metal ABC transporter substrate-binding protein [Bifidobacterium mongoliense]MDN6554302.1 metal ABC transporter substrate-binding protein [Bifidobacterium mongoliense]MDN6720069.1 metal ABC transporter substrate-binding prote
MTTDHTPTSRRSAWLPPMLVHLRILWCALVAAALLVTAGCGTSSHAATADNGKPTVLTTFTITADMARNVAGNHLNVVSIAKPGAEIHDYEPTASDIVRASKADLILDNGLGLERWFERFVANAKAPRVTLSADVTPISISEGEYAGKPNPHAWMSPKNGRLYVDAIVTAFRALDPAHADDYTRNGAAYQRRIQAVSDSLNDSLGTLPEAQRTLVSCEGAFSYLARDEGLHEAYIWPVNAESEGTPQQIAKVVDTVRRQRVPTVFCESTVNGKAMRQVAQETGAAFRQDEDHLLYVDSLSAKHGPVPTYLDLLRHDATAIIDGLTRGR